MNGQMQQKTKIMIVDDNPDLQHTLQSLLEIEHYSVVTASNGWECLKELEKGFHGIIILDLMMPVLDGVETLKKMILEGYIKENIIIILTAKKIQGEEFNEIYPYIYDFIMKPFDVNYILKTLKHLTGKLHK